MSEDISEDIYDGSGRRIHTGGFVAPRPMRYRVGEQGWSRDVAQSLGTSVAEATEAVEGLSRAMGPSYEDRVEALVDRVRDLGLDEASITETVRNLTREAVTQDLDEDEVIARMKQRLQQLLDEQQHGVSYAQDSDVAEMDVAIFTERAQPRGMQSWAEAIHFFVTRFSDHRALCERLDTARRGGRMIVEVDGKPKSRGYVTSRNHIDEVAVSILTGLPVHFRVVKHRPNPFAAIQVS